jgi:HTH-type transcriptional regulator/antitoxin HigA
MSRAVGNQFMPDYAVRPGETLLETIEALGLSQVELAERIGQPRQTVQRIIQGQAPVTPEMAVQLERVLGLPKEFWTNLERQYQETVARQSERRSDVQMAPSPKPVRPVRRPPAMRLKGRDK